MKSDPDHIKCLIEEAVTYKELLKRWLEPSNLERLRPRLEFQTGVLAGFALIASLLLGITHCSTHDAIQQRLNEDLQKSLAEVVPSTLHDNDLLQDTVTVPSAEDNLGANETTVYIARKAGQVSAVCFKLAAPDGYSGIINMVIGINRDGEVLGVRVINHAETPGLGDKIEIAKSSWILDFNGRSLLGLTDAQWAVKKDGGVFDQFAGATITPRAVVKTVHRGLQFFNRHRNELIGS
ncbi:electron transport complex subunit RsxG [Methylobacter sp. YRD-M1]|uniref:electron transport complex subunit RsxG n=1 Tax=Methylobacter sp. YRD-M1 TaxID=2911520 RepID=UPI00227A0B86|nr:electron transport complex subunit RsxG [Methylobacter sp. YRD-M1]WAK01302.1 electron transport complex subunit RsxG [Methylobacter sp. YRD-M1]